MSLFADSIVHTGDGDTSIRFPAANTFNVELLVERKDLKLIQVVM